MAQLSSMSVLAAVASVIDDGVDVMGVSTVRSSGTHALDKVVADWRIASASSLHHTDKSQSQIQMKMTTSGTSCACMQANNAPAKFCSISIPDTAEQPGWRDHG